MSDEATVHYEDFINNLKEGNEWLYEELGYRPTVGWQIDPFGHHSATAALFADMNFDAIFFARMDYQDKIKRMNESALEFLWRPFSETRGNDTEILAHMMYSHYSAPPNFCWSYQCDNDPIVDDKKLKTYNLDAKVEELHNHFMDRALHYRGRNIFVTWGDDFNFQSNRIFKNLDKVMKAFNQRYNDSQMIYSTPNDYLNALAQENITFPTKYDDLFPYADNAHSYWTGYFTSRSNLKGMVQDASQDYQNLNTLLTMSKLSQRNFNYSEEEFEMSQQMGTL